MTKVGFTGTQCGMDEMQLALLEENLRRLRGPHGENEFHHGDCVGADDQAHDVAKRLGYEIHIHPCNVPGKRANRQADVAYEVKAPLERNHDIVDVVHITLAAPSGRETMRSGTWATIRYARKENKLLTILTRGS